MRQTAEIAITQPLPVCMNESHDHVVTSFLQEVALTLIGVACSMWRRRRGTALSATVLSNSARIAASRLAQMNPSAASVAAYSIGTSKCA